MNFTPIYRFFKNISDTRAAIEINRLDSNINQASLSSFNPLNIYVNEVRDKDLKNIVDQLTALIKELRPRSISYMLQFPGWWPIVRELEKIIGGSVTFDCMDDHSGFNTNTALALNTEQDLISHADLVITSSNLLEERCRKSNPNTVQVKNGADFYHFFDCLKNGKLDYLSGSPIVGYFGAISTWFDMEIITYCAKVLPDWNFVLIGSTFGADLQDSENFSNIHFLGEIPYQNLPGYLAYFDVCVIPFKIIPLTLATNPVKFYEYLSAGKPVVAIELPELLEYKETCYLASNKEEFLLGLRMAYLERNIYEKYEARLRLAKENSWNDRGQIIFDSMIKLKNK